MKTDSSEKQKYNQHFSWLIIRIFLITGILFSTASGCALFGGKNKINEETIIEEQTQNQEEDLSEYVAGYGRANPNEKKKIDPGQTFLFSDKAKEIYANTER